MITTAQDGRAAHPDWLCLAQNLICLAGVALRYIRRSSFATLAARAAARLALSLSLPLSQAKRSEPNEKFSPHPYGGRASPLRWRSFEFATRLVSAQLTRPTSSLALPPIERPHLIQGAPAEWARRAADRAVAEIHSFIHSLALHLARGSQLVRPVRLGLYGIASVRACVFVPFRRPSQESEASLARLRSRLQGEIRGL